MRRFPAKRKVVSYTMHLNATPARIFPLLCPVREYEWIEIWDCTMVYSDSGYAENDCVFLFDLVPGQPTDTFVVSHYEVDREIQFIRFNGLRTIRMSIALVDNGDGTTDAIWKQVVTALNDRGNEFVEGFTEEGYWQEVKMVERMLEHFLATGKMLKVTAEGKDALLGTGAQPAQPGG